MFLFVISCYFSSWLAHIVSAFVFIRDTAHFARPLAMVDFYIVDVAFAHLKRQSCLKQVVSQRFSTH